MTIFFMLQERILWTAIIYCCLHTTHGKGKTAAKVGLSGLTQVSNLGATSSSSASTDEIKRERSHHNTTTVNAMSRLKRDLFVVQNYDKSMRPVKNHTDAVLLYIDITYMQVLDMNEKDQVVRSMIRYRVVWVDQYFQWDPKDYEGITDFWLPSSSMWIPDLLAYEETGGRDYSPRIPYVIVNYKGMISYFEPVAFETTCGVNIAYFPFDSQTCTFTFVSWTIPTSKLDIMSRRTADEMSKDIERYSSRNGEWILESVGVEKESEYFGEVLHSEQSDHDHNHTKENFNGNIGNEEKKDKKEKEAISRFYYMNPHETVKDVAPSRNTDLHWSQVRFTIKLRRNSALYIQSMLFPALLLTTISLLGFYLPPDSGERIGLQITILLTFMVFLLTVGDMFPASTGPYLGLYFVLCMAQLGLNIIMTVLVLYLHHMPVAMITEKNDMTGEHEIRKSAIPIWIKFALIIAGIYDALDSIACKSTELHQKRPLERPATNWLRWLREKLSTLSFVGSKAKTTETHHMKSNQIFSFHGAVSDITTNKKKIIPTVYNQSGMNIKATTSGKNPLSSYVEQHDNGVSIKPGTIQSKYLSFLLLT
ncbi:unnamed protein product [Clavelina lepadiformis]|uniref:Uncharacterized protein n=1 Tax=Clavelina lepadiformis TaxID=159417 RepID=A0ABP0FT85_CLALP